MSNQHENRLHKIESLLRKAESTSYPEEAEALTAKAEALMAQWSIDSAMLRAQKSDPSAEIETIEVVVWKSAMQAGLCELLHELVNALGCDTFYIQVHRRHPDDDKVRQARRYKVYGFPEQLQQLEWLYASLQLQASSAYQSPEVTEARVAECGTGSSAGGRAIRFKNSFMRGFARQVGARLRAIQAAQTEQSSDAPGTALVLADQSVLVRSKMREDNPRLRSGSGFSGGRGGSGGGHGRRAGDRADLGQSRVSGSRGQLGA